MKLSVIHHIAIIVSDYEVAKNFYVNKLGFSVIRENYRPERKDWAACYTGNALVVYGHTEVPQAKLVNNTIDIDQGCVYGGKLTAFRYPEREIVQVDAKRVYRHTEKPGFSKEAR